MNAMSRNIKTVKKTVKRTYFGLVSLLVAILSMGFLAAYFAVSQLNISPATFYFWNAITAFVACITTPLAFVLAFFAWRSAVDSRQLAGTAMVISGVPFLVLFVQFVLSFIP
jgi:drug/metabolite transporter (DMT)-like permease